MCISHCFILKIIYNRKVWDNLESKITWSILTKLCKLIHVLSIYLNLEPNSLVVDNCNSRIWVKRLLHWIIYICVVIANTEIMDSFHSSESCSSWMIKNYHDGVRQFNMLDQPIGYNQIWVSKFDNRKITLRTWATTSRGYAIWPPPPPNNFSSNHEWNISSMLASFCVSILSRFFGF